MIDDEEGGLITGANKGIGFETARQLAALDMSVLVGARDEARGREAERVLRHEGANTRFLRRAPAARIVNVSSEIGSISSQTDPETPFAQMPASAQYPSSKAAVNMLTAMYAKELRDTPIKVNAANPGFTDTDFTDHRGFRSAAEGAEPSIHLSTLPDDGPSGILWGHIWTTANDGGDGTLSW